MKRVYLIAAIIGAIVPYLFFFKFFYSFGVDLPLFVKQLFATSPAAGFSADLLITSFVFWVYIFKETQVKYKPAIVLINLTIGLSCAFPLFLYLNHDDA